MNVDLGAERVVCLRQQQATGLLSQISTVTENPTDVWVWQHGTRRTAHALLRHVLLPPAHKGHSLVGWEAGCVRGLLASSWPAQHGGAAVQTPGPG